jgi:tetratricopeptide (TPR) repeat protein
VVIKKTVTKPTRTPVQDRRYQQALELFAKGVKALGRKDFDRARELFDELLREHSEQNDLLERARAYRAMCNRTRRPGRPKTFEELLNYGVILHNRGEFAQAVKFLHQALEIQPRNENALYCLAAAQARAGDPGAALRTLRSAISANPATRALARKDDDFEPLRGELEFRSLVSPTVS